MPDGKVISVGKERFGCPEYLFSPQDEDESFSIQNMITDSIFLSCDDEARDTLYKNIILSGGTSFLEGLEKRLHQEIEAKAPRSIQPDDKGKRAKVIASPDRKYAVWRGGSTLASLSSFPN